jgi:predicted aspartyl protease
VKEEVKSEMKKEAITSNGIYIMLCMIDQKKEEESPKERKKTEKKLMKNSLQSSMAKKFEICEIPASGGEVLWFHAIVNGMRVKVIGDTGASVTIAGGTIAASMGAGTIKTGMGKKFRFYS